MRPDVGAPVPEESKWTQKEGAFDPLVEDEEEQEIQKQQEQQELEQLDEEEEELMSVYRRGKRMMECEGGRTFMK